MNNSTERINELTQYLRQMRLPIMADRLIDLYSDRLSDKRSTLDIIEEMVMDEYQSRRHNTIQRHLKQAKLSQPKLMFKRLIIHQVESSIKIPLIN